jgi:hypothetical protein
MNSTQYFSQYRIMFFQAACDNPVGGDWDTVAATCAQYGINVAIVECGDESGFPVPYTQVSGQPNAITWNLTGFIAAFHAVGIKVWGDFDFMIAARNSSEYIGTSSGSTDALEICDPQAWKTCQQCVTEIMKLGCDGFMVDYAYWQTSGGGILGAGDGPYDAYSQAAFSSWLSTNYHLTVTSFPSQVESGGVYANYWETWRVDMINLLMMNVSQWVHAVTPNAPIAASAFTISDIPGTYPAYWVYWIGMDAGAWVADGSVNVIMPMCYGDQNWGTEMLAWEQYTTGIAHGACALVPFLSSGAVAPVVSTSDFVKEVNSVVMNGSDGWSYYGYNGPGETSGDPDPNAVPYLQALGLPNPPTFGMSSINAQIASNTSETITWQTSSVAMSKVEYRTSPLFTWAIIYVLDGNITEVTYHPGTIVSSNTNVTSHSITLTGLTAGTTYYFRVQSIDPSGTATSKSLTFSTG